MTFKDILNSYLKELNCTSKKLSMTSKISESVISRYRSGDRSPSNIEQLEKLSDAIYQISIQNNVNYSKDEILDKFKSTIKENKFDYNNLSSNLNKLIIFLDINTNDMSKYIIFDASHISRIRYGKAKPSDPIQFCIKISNYIISKYNDEKSKGIILALTKSKKDECEKDLFNVIYNWLTNKKESSFDNINHFLENLDNFNLNDYIKAIKFDELKIPKIPFYHAKTKNYYGLEEMKEGELDFFKATVLSKNLEDIFMCSDMPMEDMAEDITFGKKWMFAIALCLKKGLKLNIIHNLDRPFNEMMLGLESWIPIYMTGQVAPYYLKEVKNSVYNHINYVSGSAYLTGECIKGFHSNGKYYLTSNLKEINYAKEKAKLLLKKANPLMEIYREENKEEYNLFLMNSSKINDDRKRFLSSLPIFTIDDKLLIKILKRNKLLTSEINKILNYKEFEKNHITEILKNNKIVDNIYKISKEDFAVEKPFLALDNMFCDKKIYYSYEEYVKHFNQTLKYSNSTYNYDVINSNYKAFRNISITILKNKYVILSKSSNPIIHFIIKHPKLVDAINNFKPIVKEEK